MNLIPLLTTVIFVATVVTIIVAIGSYAVYKVRDKMKKGGAKGGAQAAGDAETTLFFERYVPPEANTRGTAQSSER